MKDNNETIIRYAKKEDLEGIVDLLLRLKKLNEEFDSHFMVSEEAHKHAMEYLNEAIQDGEGRMLFVAENAGKIRAFLEVMIMRRIYYSPEIEARILEFYVMPEFRAKGVGRKMLREVIRELNERNILLIGAEFPSANLIAKNFYEKSGFKQVISVYFKNLEEKK